MPTPIRYIEFDSEAGLSVGNKDPETGIWDVNTPFGDFRFHGSSAEALAALKKYILNQQRMERQLQIDIERLADRRANQQPSPLP